MAYQIHEVADGDIIQASTTIEQDTQIKLNEENIEALSHGKIAEPQSEGTNGQVLTTDGNGGRSWTSPQVPTDAQVQSAVNDWLDDHPEASTTVEDGSISYAKLDTNLKGKADEITSLSSAINSLNTDGENVYHILPDGTESQKVKFADGCIVDGFYNTEPQIDIYDKGMSGANIGNRAGACITKLYTINPKHTYTIYRACAGFSFNGYYDSQKFKNGVYVRSMSTPSNQNTVQQIGFSVADKSDESGINQIRFTLVTDQIKDSYLYDNITGEVVFAGSATQYYGKKYTDGHLTDVTLLTDKNLDSIGLGLIVGKDGAVHLSQDELAIEGNGIRLAEGTIDDALYETKPRIAEYKVRGQGDDVRETYELTCITAKYNLVPGKTRIIIYQAVEPGVSISWNGRNTVSYYNGDTYLGYVSIVGSMNSENAVVATSAIAAENPDSFFLNLVTNSVDDSYAYDADTGYIYFAGKNTAYYGLESIFDAPIATGLAATIRTIDATINTLRNDNHNMIPLFLTTDQHNASISNVINVFLKNASMDKLSKILNLGDTVADHWVIVDEDHPFVSTPQLEAYAESVKNIPISKRIDVFGNHDTWYKPDESQSAVTYKTPQNYLYKYFYNPSGRYYDNYGNFTVKDDYYNVKYLIVTGYMYTGTASDYTHYEISSAALDWMIREMSMDDGYDIIVLSHQPLGANGTSYYNPVADNTFNAQGITYYDYSTIWAARKNKTSGTITDEYGVTHSYDFTGCKSDLICGLHGHEHKDGVAYVGEALCDLIFQCFSTRNSERVCYYFLIDRENRQANIWRIDTVANTYTNYQIPFESEEESEHG